MEIPLLKFYRTVVTLFITITGSLLAQEIAPTKLFKIKKFVDGDTFWVENGTEKGMKVRLIGVDAPEPRKVYQKPAEPYGRAASAHFAHILRDSLVVLTFDVDSLDSFGRTLAYAWLADGTFINAKMVEEGYATMATYPPNVRYVEQYQALERNARTEERGLWKTGKVE